jgi:hypothetical protein
LYSVGKGAQAGEHAPAKGIGMSAVFVSRTRFAVLDQTKQVRNLFLRMRLTPCNVDPIKKLSKRNEEEIPCSCQLCELFIQCWN